MVIVEGFLVLSVAEEVKRSSNQVTLPLVCCCLGASFSPLSPFVCCAFWDVCGFGSSSRGFVLPVASSGRDQPSSYSQPVPPFPGWPLLVLADLMIPRNFQRMTQGLC